MDRSKMTREAVRALLRLLEEMEREEPALLMQERREAGREGRLDEVDPLTRHAAR